MAAFATYIFCDLAEINDVGVVDTEEVPSDEPLFEIAQRF
jgi:hypothetical protein